MSDVLDVSVESLALDIRAIEGEWSGTAEFLVDAKLPGTARRGGGKPEQIAKVVAQVQAADLKHRLTFAAPTGAHSTCESDHDSDWVWSGHYLTYCEQAIGFGGEWWYAELAWRSRPLAAEVEDHAVDATPCAVYVHRGERRALVLPAYPESAERAA